MNNNETNKFVQFVYSNKNLLTVVYVLFPFGVLTTLFKLIRLDKKAFGMFIDELGRNDVFRKVLVDNGFMINERKRWANAIMLVPRDVVDHTTDEEKKALINSYLIEKLLPINKTLSAAKVLDIVAIEERMLTADKVLVSIKSAYSTQLTNYQRLLRRLSIPLIIFWGIVAFTMIQIILINLF